MRRHVCGLVSAPDSIHSGNQLVLSTTFISHVLVTAPQFPFEEITSCFLFFFLAFIFKNVLFMVKYTHIKFTTWTIFKCRNFSVKYITLLCNQPPSFLKNLCSFGCSLNSRLQSEDWTKLGPSELPNSLITVIGFIKKFTNAEMPSPRESIQKICASTTRKEAFSSYFTCQTDRN